MAKRFASLMERLPEWLAIGVLLIPYFIAVAVLKITDTAYPLLWLSFVVIAYAVVWQLWFSHEMRKTDGQAEPSEGESCQGD